MDEVYAPVVAGLRERSVRCWFQNPDQLVLSRQAGPAWPYGGNSFWTTYRQGEWYLCTWAPMIYRMPADIDRLELYVAFVDYGTGAQARVPADLVERYRLVELPDEEAARLLGWNEAADEPDPD
jgi:hypothetical protein